MKKYIRTKDGIFEVKERRIIFPVIPAGEPITIFNTNTLEKEVIKQADTIEELCDVYVFVSPELTRPQLVLPTSFDYVRKEFQQVDIYGANWTSKGLIYVAKMNEKGELELL